MNQSYKKKSCDSVVEVWETAGDDATLEEIEQQAKRIAQELVEETMCRELGLCEKDDQPLVVRPVEQE